MLVDLALEYHMHCLPYCMLVLEPTKRGFSVTLDSNPHNTDPIEKEHNQITGQVLEHN